MNGSGKTAKSVGNKVSAELHLSYGELQCRNLFVRFGSSRGLFGKIKRSSLIT